MTAKTFYTYQELTRRSTEQLVRIYERLFNTDIAADFFNPYQSRQEILLVLFAEMNAQQIVAQHNQNGYSIEPYQAMKIVVSADGMAVLWNTGEIKINNVQVSAEQMEMVRALREDGLKYKEIVAATGIPQITIFRILKGGYALEENRWNADRKNKPVTGKWNFRAEGAVAAPAAQSVRANSEFWTNLGL